MKPIVKYRGGKTKEIPQITKHIPEFTGRYIEPFCGGGALFFHLEPTGAIINDVNKNLMDFYHGIKEDYDTIKDELSEIEKIYSENREKYQTLKSKTPNDRVHDENEKYYYFVRDMYNNLIEKEFSFSTIYYYINKTAYSGMIRFNSNGHFNVPYGRYKNFNTSLLTKEHHLLLEKTTVLNKDYAEIFAIASSDDFIFLDPPYDCTFSDYGNQEMKDGFGEERHRKLASDFKNLPCKALLVIGKTPLTEELYGEMIVSEYDKSYAVNIRNRFKSESKHILVVNQ